MAREIEGGKKLDRHTVRLGERDNNRMEWLARKTGIPVAILMRKFVLEGIAALCAEMYSDENLSSSDFAPLSAARSGE